MQQGQVGSQPPPSLPFRSKHLDRGSLALATWKPLSEGWRFFLPVTIACELASPLPGRSSPTSPFPLVERVLGRESHPQLPSAQQGDGIRVGWQTSIQWDALPWLAPRLPPVGALSQRGRFHGWEKVHDAAAVVLSRLKVRAIRRHCGWSRQWSAARGASKTSFVAMFRLMPLKHCGSRCILQAANLNFKRLKFKLAAETWFKKGIVFLVVVESADLADQACHGAHWVLQAMLENPDMLMVSYLISAAVAIQFLQFTKKYNKEVLVIVGQALADFGACLCDHVVDGHAVKVISGGAAKSTALVFLGGDRERLAQEAPAEAFLDEGRHGNQTREQSIGILRQPKCDMQHALSSKPWSLVQNGWKLQLPEFVQTLTGPTSVRNKVIYYLLWFRSWWLETFQKLWQTFVPYLPKRGWTILPGLMCEKFACTTLLSAGLPLWEMIPFEEYVQAVPLSCYRPPLFQLMSMDAGHETGRVLWIPKAFDRSLRGQV